MTEINVKTSNQIQIVADPAGSEMVEVRLVEQSVNVQADHFYVGLGGGEGGTQQTLTSTLSVSSGALVGYVGGVLVLYDAASPAHQYGLFGMATNAANPGEPLTIQLLGTITIAGWGLIPGQTYRAGLSGQITPLTPVSAVFSQVIGRAINANTFFFSPQTSIKTNG